MIILLCSVRVFKRNINIKCLSLRFTCMTNAITWRACACDLANYIEGFLFGWCVCLGCCINDSIVTNKKWQKIYTCVCVRMGH